jgi:hypothetical protein
MYSKTKETARLYKLLADRLGNDAPGKMFKYIDNKTGRAVEASIKTLATNEDIYRVRKELDVAKADLIKWMFIFWIGQVGATLAMFFLYLTK